MKWRKTMATATATHATTAEHIKRFETKISAVKQAVDGLPGDDYFNELFKIIHRPGWTTIAEGVLFETMVDTMLAQTRQLAQMHQQLMTGAQAVGQ
jgi:hypothetical protein